MNEKKEIILKRLNCILKKKQIQINYPEDLNLNLQEKGLNSLSIVEFLLDVKQSLNIDIEPAKLNSNNFSTLLNIFETFDQGENNDK